MVGICKVNVKIRYQQIPVEKSIFHLAAANPIDHFDIYLGEHFEKAVSDQLEFFKKHLLRGQGNCREG